ncbi:MAG: CRR6 family NdhI maturation factor [Leptolyngbyaceae cyanobacterium bins.59]|nr:CRR6 family NdhI maturation factor [Leptolyngbyaceae cyanobacterium bins.59]
MPTSIVLNASTINTLDLTPIQQVIETWFQTGTIAKQEQQLQFQIEYPREASDPRELSEIPEIRLWFIRLDTVYPWIPFLLDWKAGELARYAAMLVPHQFSPKEGIAYNPEALEIFVMQKVFVLMDWMRQQGIEGRSRLKSMAQMLGYDLEDEFFEAIGG